MITPEITNCSLLVRSDDNSAELYFELGGILPWSANYSYAAPSLFGSNMDLFFISISYANASFSTPGTGFSFYLSDYSFQSDYPYFMLPMRSQGYYPLGAAWNNGVLITPSRGCELMSSGPIYNSTGILGLHEFWVNFTIHPMLYFGPYYTLWSPIHMSVNWVDNFSTSGMV